MPLSISTPYILFSEATHGDRIQRNLMESGCILDPTRRDGDSVFRLVILSLRVLSKLRFEAQ